MDIEHRKSVFSDRLCSQNLTKLMWRTCSFNKSVPHASHHTKQFNYWKSYFPVVSFLVLVTKIGRPDLVIWQLWTFFFGIFWSHKLMWMSPRHFKHWKKKLYAASMKYRNLYGKFHEKSTYVPAKPSRPFTWCVIPYITSWCLHCFV